MEYVVIAIFIIMGIGASLFVHGRRTSKDYREHIEPVLNAHGLEFKSSEYPGMFKVGPFPKFSVTAGRSQSRIGGIRGEYSQYRIVECSDSQGNSYKLWVLIEFEMFVVHSICWRVESNQHIPPSMASLVEPST